MITGLNLNQPQRTKNLLGQVRRLVEQHWKMIRWTKKALERLVTDSGSVWKEQSNIMRWQIISEDSNSTEFLATLTSEFEWSSLFLWGVTLESHQKDRMSLVNLSTSRPLMWQLSSEAVSCWVTASIYWATALLSHYYAELLLCWATRVLLSELRELFDTHFVLFLDIFRLPSRQNNLSCQNNLSRQNAVSPK